MELPLGHRSALYGAYMSKCSSAEQKYIFFQRKHRRFWAQKDLAIHVNKYMDVCVCTLRKGPKLTPAQEAFVLSELERLKVMTSR